MSDIQNDTEVTSATIRSSDQASLVKPGVQHSAPTADINAAAALRAQYAIQVPKPTRRRQKKNEMIKSEEPLVDCTAALQLHSKKTERLQKRQQKRSEKAAGLSATASILDLPSELFYELLCNLRPSDIFNLQRTSHSIREVVLEHENVISRKIIHRRYWTLHRCFPLPVAFEHVPLDAQPALLNERRQEMLNIHRKSYHQHIQMIDPHTICTCMTCVFSWNNLCLIIDLHHWQYNLEHREPIPMIARGSNPQWNQDLLSRNAKLVEEAMRRPLMYAYILQKHLATITGTILRFARWKKKGAVSGKPRLYHMTDDDVDTGSDAFLDCSGPPSYDFPFHRDNYYTLEAYLPNRKWSAETKRWHYYALPPAQHERDLDWVKSFVKVPTAASVNTSKEITTNAQS